MTGKAIISLMPSSIASVTRSPVHVNELVPVVISPNVTDGEIYKVAGKIQVGKKWIEQYTFTKLALDKLQIAAGVKDIKDSCYVELVEERVWSGHYSGVYTTPTGIEIELSDVYTFDARVEGARWDEKKNQEIDKAIKKQANNWKLTPEGTTRIFTDLPTEQREAIEYMAEALATRFVQQAAQFGAQRAMTGARDRALRRYFQIGKYTLDVIKNSMFQITRTRYDYDKMAETLGPGQANVFQFGILAKEAGLDLEELARVQMMLEAGPTEIKEQEDVVIDPVVTTIDPETLPEDPGNIFEVEASTKTIAKARSILESIINGDVSMRLFWSTAERYIGEGNDSEGAIQVLGLFLEKIKSEVDVKVSDEDLVQAKVTYSLSAQRFIEAGIVPKIDDIMWQQQELPLEATIPTTKPTPPNK